MSETAVIGGPVSAALEADLRRKVQIHSIIVWLDADNRYSAFVDRLVAASKAGTLPYAVRSFRGSHLSLMLELEDVAGGVDKPSLVIHLPGFNMETVRHTPVYELYVAGTCYQKALDTLVTEAAAGRVRPDQTAAFTSQPGLTLAAADEWLTALLNSDDNALAAQLRTMQPSALFDDLLSNGYVAERVRQAEDAVALWDRLSSWTGLPASWRDLTLPQTDLHAEDFAFAAASWALCVEYVWDLKRAPASPQLESARGLPLTVVRTCRNIAAHLRERHARFYRRTADETEALLADEVEAAKAEDLGNIDTFRFEEEMVLKAALSELQARAWEPAARWATLRINANRAAASFWLQEDPARQSAWQLVQGAARLGEAIVLAGEHLMARSSLGEAVDLYIKRGVAVDQAHRHLEQRRVALLYPQVPEFETLRSCLDALRLVWRKWADAWARDFNLLCREHGFLPAVALQQRALFDEVVKPLTQTPGITAYFVVDAFRYEMGDELYRQLKETPATNVQLNARLAELPTVTEVGMNVLAPVLSNGRLVPAVLNPENGGSLGGFSTGEFRVNSPETRKRAMHDRVGGATSPWLTLEEVLNRDNAALKRTVAQARLVIVHSQEIDNAGENGMGPAVFDNVMQKLRAAWRLLRDAGVRRFVFTADHGFLLLNESTASAQAHGRKIDPMRRHVFSPVAADHAGEVRVPLSALGYEGASGYLMFPESTAVFDTGRRSMSFVHGGNSLQERVIPVLTMVHRAAAGGNTLQYGIMAKERDGVAGMHCLEVKVDVVAQQVLEYEGPKEIELALRAPDSPGVQVELCQTRGKARIVGGAVQATVNETFEIFFRLTGRSDARILVELHHPSAVADVIPCVPDARFAVTATRLPSELAPEPAAAATENWLEQLPEGGVRQLFAHLMAYGTVTEGEAATMLGDPRAVRRFALQFDDFAKKAPFVVRIDVVAGVKRYVRERSNQ